MCSTYATISNNISSDDPFSMVVFIIDSSTIHLQYSSSNMVYTSVYIYIYGSEGRCVTRCMYVFNARYENEGKVYKHVTTSHTTQFLMLYLMIIILLNNNK